MDWNDMFNNFGDYALRGLGYMAVIFLFILALVLLGSPGGGGVALGLIILVGLIAVIAVRMIRKDS